MCAQLVLPVRLPDEASFANFLVSAANRRTVERLQGLLGQSGWKLLLHGPPGSGRSHLLAACCQQLQGAGQPFAYLPMAELRGFAPAEVFAGLEGCALACVDDLDALLGDAGWEEALFHLCNRCAESSTRLLFAATRPPAELGIRLADLGSRLGAAHILPLAELGDEDKSEALRLHAHVRGMTLDADVTRYILSRSARGMPALIAVLDRLDAATLEAGRRISIPFVKSVLEESPS